MVSKKKQRHKMFVAHFDPDPRLRRKPLVLKDIEYAGDTGAKLPPTFYPYFKASDAPALVFTTRDHLDAYAQTMRWLEENPRLCPDGLGWGETGE